MSVSRREALTLGAFLVASPFVLRPGVSDAAAPSVVAVGGPVRIGIGETPKMAAFPNGNFVVTWRQLPLGKYEYAGFFRVFDQKGAALSHTSRAAVPEVDYLEPLINSEGRGQWLASYRPRGKFSQIVSQSLTSQFVAEKPILVADLHPASAFVKVRVLASRLTPGPALVIWEGSRERYEGSPEGAVVRADGSRASTFTLQSPHGSLKKELIALTSLAGGAAAYAYVVPAPDYNSYTLFIQRLDSSHQRVGSPLPLERSLNPGKASFSPRPGGGFVVVWNHYNKDRVQYVAWKVISSTGVASKTFLSKNNAQPTDFQEAPAIACDVDGRFVVASVAAVAGRSKIAIRVLAKDGAPIGTPIYIDAAVEPWEIYQIARLKAGLFAIVYIASDAVINARLIKMS